MKILITGGLGYLGGRIAVYLKQNSSDSEIVIAERPSFGAYPSWSRDFEVVEMELLSKDSIQSAIEKTRPDYIIHLAALNEIDSAKDPSLADKVNHIGTRRLVDASKKYSVKKFIYFSTFHVYGKSVEGVITEKTIPDPVHPYASSHLDAEKAVNKARGEGFDTLVLRLSNSFGYPMDKDVNRWTLLVNDLCRQVVLEKKIKLHSSGKQYRDFITITDVAGAVYHFLFNASNKWDDGLYNLGSGKTTTILDMANCVLEVYNNKYDDEISNIEAETKKNNDTVKFQYSIDKLLATGFFLEGDAVSEISKTMDICQGFK